MTENLDGTVIPFPTRPVAALAPPAPPEDTAERLRRSVAMLEKALEAQRAAVARWQGSLGELRTVMQGLGGTLQDYNGKLETLGGRLQAIGAESRRLAEWADAHGAADGAPSGGAVRG